MFMRCYAVGCAIRGVCALALAAHHLVFHQLHLHLHLGYSLRHVPGIMKRYGAYARSSKSSQRHRALCQEAGSHVGGQHGALLRPRPDRELIAAPQY